MLIVAVGQATHLDDSLLRLAERGASVWVAGDPASAARLLESIPGNVEPVRLDDLEVDVASRRATWRGKSLGLSRSEVGILGLLTSNPGTTFGFADVDAAARGRRAYLGDSSPVRSAVKRLRRKLRATSSSLSIESVRGVGFRLVPVPRSS